MNFAKLSSEPKMLRLLYLTFFSQSLKCFYFTVFSLSWSARSSLLRAVSTNLNSENLLIVGTLQFNSLKTILKFCICINVKMKRKYVHIESQPFFSIFISHNIKISSLDHLIIVLQQNTPLLSRFYRFSMEEHLLSGLLQVWARIIKDKRERERAGEAGPGRCHETHETLSQLFCVSLRTKAVMSS